MRAEKVINSLLGADSGVGAVVGSRIYPSRLPQNTTMPAMAYEVISGTELTPIDAQAGYQVMRTRMRITAMGKNYIDVKNAIEAVRVACLYKSGTIAGVKVISITRDNVGPDLRDDELSIYLQSIDFIVMHYES
jgi:hypothetical protein